MFNGIVHVDQEVNSIGELLQLEDDEEELDRSRENEAHERIVNIQEEYRERVHDEEEQQTDAGDDEVQQADPKGEIWIRVGFVLANNVAENDHINEMATAGADNDGQEENVASEEDAHDRPQDLLGENQEKHDEEVDEEEDEDDVEEDVVDLLIVVSGVEL